MDTSVDPDRSRRTPRPRHRPAPLKAPGALRDPVALDEIAPGVFRDGKRLLTENLVPGTQVYGERLVRAGGVEHRAWNPKRSKLAAAILKGMPWDLPRDAAVLYLGAANGTTASHVSDIVAGEGGVVYAVEVSPRAMRDLLAVVEDRTNMVPILADAHRPGDYRRYVAGRVDLVYQDVAQRDQVGLFLKNVDAYLADGGRGVLMVKARSVDVAKDPKDVFDEAADRLAEHGLAIRWRSGLEPFEKDHEAFLVERAADADAGG